LKCRLGEGAAVYFLWFPQVHENSVTAPEDDAELMSVSGNQAPRNTLYEMCISRSRTVDRLRYLSLIFGDDIPAHFPSHFFFFSFYVRGGFPDAKLSQRIQKADPLRALRSQVRRRVITEVAFTEKRQLKGVRVVKTERAWTPGERVTVKSYTAPSNRGQRNYWSHLAKKRYAVGWSLHSAVGTWADTSQPPRLGR